MTFLTANDQPHASILMFNSLGQVLARKENGLLGIPTTPVMEEEDLRAAAVRVAGKVCLVSPSKMYPIFGHKIKDKHHTVFLVTHCTLSGGMPPASLDGNCWADLYDLCTESKSTNPEFYRGLFGLIFKKVLPAAV